MSDQAIDIKETGHKFDELMDKRNDFEAIELLCSLNTRDLSKVAFNSYHSKHHLELRDDGSFKFTVMEDSGGPGQTFPRLTITSEGCKQLKDKK